MLYLIKSHRGSLSDASLNSTSHEGMLSFMRLMYSGSSNRLEVIFQKRVRVFHRGFKHEKTDVFEF